MEDKNSTITEVKDNVDSKDKNDTTNSDTKDTATETVTMSKVDYDKAIQGVRDEYSKQIKELEEKVKELSPIEKAQAEIEIEKRLAALEASENEVKLQKNRLDMQEKLSTSGLDKTLADFIKDDADVDKLSALVEDIVKSKMKSNGYVPSDHSSEEKVTPEEFAKWTYSQKADFAQKHPESYKRLRGKK